MPRGIKAGSGVNKLEAVRQVIKTRGQETKAAEIVKFVKSEHGATISIDLASNYKSTALKQLGLKGKGKLYDRLEPGWKTAAVASNGEVATVNVATAAPRTSGGGITLEDIAAVKKLVDQIGAEKVKQLAQVLAR